MATPYAESPADAFDYQTDFLEVIDNQAPHSAHLSNDVQEAEVLGWVRANKVRSAVRYFCGFAHADAGDPFRLNRENPPIHLSHSQLRAYDVTVREAVPLSEANDLYLRPKKESPFVTEFFSGNYKWALLTVRYRNFMHRFLEDDDITDPTREWKRNVWVQTEPRVEALTVSGGQSQLVFAESSETGPAVPTDAGAPKTPFPAPVAMLLSKKGVVVHWYGVPWEYLSADPDIFEPTNLDAVVGCVNSDTFMDRYPPGTLLAEPYSYTPGTWAVPPADPAEPLRKVDVQMHFSFFDPERAATRPAGAPFARGHNLMPWGGNGAGAAPGGDGGFYLATRDGTAGGARLIRSAPFQFVFRHVLDPGGEG